MNPSKLDNPIYVETKRKLDEVGCGMCLAKWTQVTMHLQLGHTHSCHHPRTHKISLNELKRVAKSNENIFKYIIDAIKANATLGEISDTLRQEFGEYA